MCGFARMQTPLISQYRPPGFLNADPRISRQKKVNDRRSLPPSETNGGMDRFGAQSCKFATARVNLQISQLFPSS